MNPYIIGFVASDGHVDLYNWLISQSHKSMDALYKIQKFFGGKLKVQNSANSYSEELKYNLIFSKKIDFNLFKDWGVPEGNKTYTLRFPLMKTKEQIWLYLRGFFDGDGSVSFEKNKYPRVELISNSAWCYECKKFLIRNEIKCYTYNDKRHLGITRVIIHRINSVHLFFDKIYENIIPLFMDRKYYRWMEIKALCPLIKERRENKKLSLNDLNKIRFQLESNIALNKIAQTFQNYAVISKIYKEEFGGRKKSSVDKEVLAEKLFREGKTIKELKNFGVGYKIGARVYKRIKNTLPSRKKSRISDENRMNIILQLKEGLTTKEINKKLGISNTTINKINRELTGGFEVKLLLKKAVVKDLILKGLGRNKIYKQYHFSKSLIKKVKEEINAEVNGV